MCLGWVQRGGPAGQAADGLARAWTGSTRLDSARLGWDRLGSVWRVASCGRGTAVGPGGGWLALLAPAPAGLSSPSRCVSCSSQLTPLLLRRRALVRCVSRVASSLAEPWRVPPCRALSSRAVLPRRNAVEHVTCCYHLLDL